MKNEKTLREFVSPDNQNILRSELFQIMKDAAQITNIAIEMKITHPTLKKFIFDGKDVEWTTLAKIEKFLINRAKNDIK